MTRNDFLSFTPKEQTAYLRRERRLGKTWEALKQELKETKQNLRLVLLGYPIITAKIVEAPTFTPFDRTDAKGKECFVVSCNGEVYVFPTFEVALACCDGTWNTACRSMEQDGDTVELRYPASGVTVRELRYPASGVTVRVRRTVYVSDVQRLS